jgi:hypothetical protein
MKSKALITIAVASTFGWSAGAFAGSSHEVMTPFSPNESGENIVSQHQGFGSASTSTAASDTISQDTGHDLILSDSSDWSASFDQMAEADVGDLYLVTWTPATVDSWDYYALDSDSIGQLALNDSDESYVFVPSDYIALIADDGYGMTQEDQVDTVLSLAPVFDTAEVG